MTIESEKISAKEVRALLLSCLFKEGEDTTNYVPAEGILSRLGFHPERLEQARPQVVAWLNLLPDNFKEEGGGGMSFLAACMDKNGVHWGEHQSMEQLFLLGIGLGLVKCLLPRDMWQVLPGGMPYYVVLKAK